MSAASLTLFQDRDSVVQRLDPRAKVTAILLIVLALCLPSGVVVKGALAAGLIVAWFVARLSLRSLLLAVASLSVFFASTIVLRVFIRPVDRTELLSLGPVDLPVAGLVDAAQMCLQIFGLVVGLWLLVRTTASQHLAEGVELMLQPTKRWGVPVHEAVIMFSIALRFLPIMIREFSRLQTAQIARGGGIQRRGILARVQAVLPLLIPMVVVTLVRARDLSEAMDARGYRGDVERTPVREYTLSPADIAAIVVAVLALAAAVVVSFS